MYSIFVHKTCAVVLLQSTFHQFPWILVICVAASSFPPSRIQLSLVGQGWMRVTSNITPRSLYNVTGQLAKCSTSISVVHAVTFIATDWRARIDLIFQLTQRLGVLEESNMSLCLLIESCAMSCSLKYVFNSFRTININNLFCKSHGWCSLYFICRIEQHGALMGCE
jgi:hypothetical protein